jgi:MFS family permease
MASILRKNRTMVLQPHDKTLLLLFICQALFWSAVLIGITLTSLVGARLAGDGGLATLPVAMLTLGAIIVTGPASLYMQRVGRRGGFLIGGCAGVLGGIVCMLGIFQESFAIFCLGNLILGAYQAFAYYYRLAATDRVPSAKRGRAIAWVMAGSVVAALVAPSLAIWSQNLFLPVVFAGSYGVVAALGLTTMAVVAFIPRSKPIAAVAGTEGRPLCVILRQPLFMAAIANAGISHGVMILAMVSTPLAMIGCGYPVTDAAFVIQWHVLGMFLPSFFSGKWVDRFGAPFMGMLGAAILAASAGVALMGQRLEIFWLSSTLLGVGWNFMYVAGTTMIAAAHGPEERGRAQGAAELAIAIIAALAAFASGGLLNGYGWEAVNLSMLPLLIVAAALTLWLTRPIMVRSV